MGVTSQYLFHISRHDPKYMRVAYHIATEGETESTPDSEPETTPDSPPPPEAKKLKPGFFKTLRNIFMSQGPKEEQMKADLKEANKALKRLAKRDLSVEDFNVINSVENGKAFAVMMASFPDTFTTYQGIPPVKSAISAMKNMDVYDMFRDGPKYWDTLCNELEEYRREQVGNDRVQTLITEFKTHVQTLAKEAPTKVAELLNMIRSDIQIPRSIREETGARPKTDEAEPSSDRKQFPTLESKFSDLDKWMKNDDKFKPLQPKAEDADDVKAKKNDSLTRRKKLYTDAFSTVKEVKAMFDNLATSRANESDLENMVDIIKKKSDLLKKLKWSKPTNKAKKRMLDFMDVAERLMSIELSKAQAGI